MDAMINLQDSPRERSLSVPLMVMENGCGSPCIDLRQVSSELAAAAKDADLVSIILFLEVNGVSVGVGPCPLCNEVFIHTLSFPTRSFVIESIH